jgi:hypothetical protein
MSDISVSTVNCDDFCNTLGYLIAIQSMDSNTNNKMHRIASIIAIMRSILDANERLDVSLDKRGTTYRKIFKNYSARWKKALQVYSNNTDEWKDTLAEIEDIYQAICAIALREGLAKNIYKEIHNIKFDQTCEFDNTPIEGDL